MVKLPGYIVEFQIAMDGVKRYTGWTDEEFAQKLGVTDRTLRNMRRDPCSANGGLILQIQDMLKKFRQKAGVI